MPTEEESILQEAQRLTTQDRRAAYGHPLDDWGRTVALANALFAHKLREPLTPEDGCMFMVLVKLSREMHFSQRDNIVDGCGYLNLMQMIKDERRKRVENSMQGS